MPSEHDKDETFEAIFDFKMLQGTEYHNIDNEFTLSVLVGNTGDKIGRESLTALNSDYIDHHPNSNKLMKCLHAWFWFSGGIKSYSNFRGQGITLADKKVYMQLSNGHPEVENIAESFPYAETIPEKIYGYEKAVEGGYEGISDESLDACEETWGKLYYKDQVIPEWTRSVLEYEWKVDNSYIEAIEDNTILICFNPLKSRWRNGWEVESVILNSGETKATTKKGNPCYLFVGGSCEVTDTSTDTTHQFAAWDCKKLTKENYVLKNTGTETLKALRFYKNV